MRVLIDTNVLIFCGIERKRCSFIGLSQQTKICRNHRSGMQMTVPF